MHEKKTDNYLAAKISTLFHASLAVPCLAVILAGLAAGENSQLFKSIGVCIIWPFTFGEFFKIKTKRDSKCSRRDNSAAKNYEVTQITAPQLRVDYLSNDREPVQRFNYRFYFCIFSSVLFSALCIPGFFRFYFPFASAWTKDLMTPHVPEYELSFGFHYRA